MIKNSLYIFWFLGVGYVLTHLHALHYVDQSPKGDGEFKDLLVKKGLLAEEKDQWTLVHVVDPECECSKIVIESLYSREQKDANLQEIVISPKAKEIDLESLSRKNMKHVPLEDLKSSVNGVPFMIVYQGSELRYLGGYRQGSLTPLHPPEDMQILNRLQAHEEVRAKVAIGCHVSKEYQSKIDPLGVKYGKK